MEGYWQRLLNDMAALQGRWHSAFLRADPNIFSIPKAGRPEHVKENSGGAGDWGMTADDLIAIDRASPAPHIDVPLEMI